MNSSCIPIWRQDLYRISLDTCLLEDFSLSPLLFVTISNSAYHRKSTITTGP